MNNMQTDQNKYDNKKSYSTPKLKNFGNINELTQATFSGSGSADTSIYAS